MRKRLIGLDIDTWHLAAERVSIEGSGVVTAAGRRLISPSSVCGVVCCCSTHASLQALEAISRLLQAYATIMWLC